MCVRVCVHKDSNVSLKLLEKNLFTENCYVKVKQSHLKEPCPHSFAANLLLLSLLKQIERMLEFHFYSVTVFNHCICSCICSWICFLFSLQAAFWLWRRLYLTAARTSYLCSYTINIVISLHLHVLECVTAFSIKNEETELNEFIIVL